MRKVLFILGQLTDTDIDWLARAGRRMDAAPGHILITTQTRIADLVIVLDGQVEVSVGGHVLARLGRGEILGEMSLIEDTLPSANARTAAPSTLLLVPLSVMRAKLEADTGFAARFYRAVALFLSDRMRNTIAQLGYGSAPEPVPALDTLEELDSQVMDHLHLAGQRFLTVLDRVLATHR